MIFGDHGVVTQDVPAGRADLIGAAAVRAPADDAALVLVIETAEPQNGADDVITGDAGDDRIGGGNGDDTINGNDGVDLVFGDHGRIDYADARLGVEPPDVITTHGPTRTSAPRTAATTSSPATTATTSSSAATAATSITGDDGNDLIFGDHGDVDGIRRGDGSSRRRPPARIDTLLPPSLRRRRPRHPFALDVDRHGCRRRRRRRPAPRQRRRRTSIDRRPGRRPILRQRRRRRVIGGQDATAHGGTGDDDLIGGHNVAGGSDAGDFIDGGAGNDVIAGDNANLLRTGDIVQPALPGAHRRRDLRRTDTGCADIATRRRVRSSTRTPANDDPRGVKERDVVLFDHDAATPRRHVTATTSSPAAPRTTCIFGQLGDDWIQGDGSAIDDAGAITVDVRTTRLSVEDWAGIGRDGDDYIEGNGGDDVDLRRPRPGRPDRRQLDTCSA